MSFSSKSSLTVIYMFKVNNKNTRTRREIRSKSTIKEAEQRQLKKGKIIISPTPLICVKYTKIIARKSLDMLICRLLETFQIPQNYKENAIKWGNSFYTFNMYSSRTPAPPCMKKNFRRVLVLQRSRKWLVYVTLEL